MFSNENAEKSSAKKYECLLCDYNTSKKSNYDKHILTSKHQKAMIVHEKIAKIVKSSNETKYRCECGKKYNDNSGLWRHKKVCIVYKNNYSNNEYESEQEKEKEPTDKEIMMELIKNNTEVQKMMIELIKKGTNNVNCNNTNNTNKTFNMNVYLNETCKDAMNISDFVNSIQINLEDLENTGRKGYVKGISDIFLKNLNKVEHHMRSIHCSDQKREIIYIKDNDKWQKEGDEKPILTKAIKNIANQNIKQIKTWTENNPGCTHAESKKNDFYLKIVSNSMNGLTEEEGRKNINKIISNVAKEVVINKY
jgi:hypothetical protein